ncbi:helix-turn-helix domain-containing protein [Paraglaciecola aquimarina]|uniref:Helix-turn-helix domain-containing protein n=1 Tax=Paraglaciecola algarum TaxID=3050085 RepID=A0ABS9DBQ2_9ALTE|nr:helix-turn-helix domain-containing protein [Paraglaciecola sp. G1-23]MCF2950386.1 helix-turn-helix domain-containing protein [Paraglaciecola sp. G1-23]
MSENSYLPSKQEAQAQLERINSSALGRSKNQQKLLEYLLNRELESKDDGHSESYIPKEIEIAIDVFGKSSDFNPTDDSTVRVNISNLRKKLENYYSSKGIKETFVITIPIGGYRLVFKKNTEVNPVNTASASARKEDKALTGYLKPTYVLVILLVVSIVVNLFLGFYDAGSTPKLAKTRAKTHLLWADLESSTKPIMVVLGDIYNFSEFEESLNRRRTILDTNVNSDDDLQQYLAKYPEASNITMGFRQKLVNKGSVIALKNIFNLIDDKKRVNYRIASELTVYHLRTFDIIYLGPLNAMGILEEYFKGSHFQVDKHNLVLANDDLTKRYSSPQNITESYIDYGLFAKVDGPRNNKIYIMSGFSDPSIMQVSWYMTNNTDLWSKEFETLISDYQLSSLNNFEMIFKVPSMDGVDIKHKIIYAGTVDSSAIWTSAE